MVFLCDYSGYIRPEIVKVRPVVVVSRRPRGIPLGNVIAIVVPLSRIPPITMRPWHVAIAARKYVALDACWAKGDLVSHVSVARLSFLIHQRQPVVPVLDGNDLRAVRHAVVKALDIR